ncbi:uncharacterized protein [Chironomus tepperi]|uniref:uncharacterized protein n=1 Tax=Chironomus tepperi TaxID=113505 RepID=UPI00391F27CB
MNFFKILELIILLIGSGSSHGHWFNATCIHETNFDLGLAVCKINPGIQSVHYENTQIGLKNAVGSLAGLIAEDVEMLYIPNGIEIFIKPLKLLSITKAKLRKITKQNFEKFDNLFYLDLSYNEIEILEDNLFRANKYLTTIILNSNRIKVVEANAFNSLSNLRSFDFRNNECYSNYSNESHNIAFLIKHIETVCLNYNLKLWNRISENNEKFDNLTKENAIMRKRFEDLVTNHSASESRNLILVTAILVIFGVVLLIILAIALIYLKYKSLNHQNSATTTNKVRPYEAISPPISNFTISTDCTAITNTMPNENCENVYSEVPYDEVQKPNNTQNNVNTEDFYAELDNQTQPKSDDEVRDLYAIVNKENV